MPTMLPALTELDAVNEMLMSIGQAPVSTIETSAVGDVPVARLYLRNVTRYVQLYGFAFNSDRAYVLSPDIDGVVLVPDGILKLDPTDPQQSLTRRRHPTKGIALWDLANQTWVCSEPVECDVVWGFVYDDLPESAKAFICTAAARKFQARIIGSQQLDGYNAEDEMKAWAILLREERAARDTNLFRQNPTLAKAGHRPASRNA